MTKASKRKQINCSNRLIVKRKVQSRLKRMIDYGLALFGFFLIFSLSRELIIFPTFIWLIIFLACIGFILRLYKYPTTNPSFWICDEGIIIPLSDKRIFLAWDDIDYIQKIMQNYFVISHQLPFTNRFYTIVIFFFKPVFSFSPRTHTNCDRAIQRLQGKVKLVGFEVSKGKI